MEAEAIQLSPGWQDHAGASWSPPTYTRACPCDPCPHRCGCQVECKPFQQWVTRGSMPVAKAKRLPVTET